MIECDNFNCENLVGPGQGVHIDGYLYCCQKCADQHQELRKDKVPHKHSKPEK